MRHQGTQAAARGRDSVRDVDRYATSVSRAERDRGLLGLGQDPRASAAYATGGRRGGHVDGRGLHRRPTRLRLDPGPAVSHGQQLSVRQLRARRGVHPAHHGHPGVPQEPGTDRGWHRRALDQRVGAVAHPDARSRAPRRLRVDERCAAAGGARAVPQGPGVHVDDPRLDQPDPGPRHGPDRLLQRGNRARGSQRGLAAVAGLPHQVGRRQQGAVAAQPHRQSQPGTVEDFRRARAESHAHRPRGLRRRQGLSAAAERLSVGVWLAK